jgi:hypothetical protein
MPPQRARGGGRETTLPEDEETLSMARTANPQDPSAPTANGNGHSNGGGGNGNGHGNGTKKVTGYRQLRAG